MFKTLFLSAAALALGVSAQANAAAYHGEITAAPQLTNLQGEFSFDQVVFGCSDSEFGEFDMCIYKSVFIRRPQVAIHMNATVNPKIAGEYPHILMKYRLVNNDANSGNVKLVNLMADGQQPFNLHVYSGNNSIVYRESTDGGQTWTNAKLDPRFNQ